MKATYKHIAFAALALSAAACSQDDDFVPSHLSDPDAVRITAQIGTDDVTGGFTRSNPLGTEEEQAKFKSSDQISVTAGTQATVTYTLGTDGTWALAGTDYLKWETETMDVTACYPAGKNDASATTFTVPTGYADLAALADADYMTYSGQQTKGDDNSISLTMQRKMVRIVIDQIKYNNQFCDEEGNPVYSVTGIKVHANSTGYAGGKVATGSITVTAYKHTDGAFYALLAPTNEGLNETFLTVTVKNNTDDTDVHTLYVKDIPATEAGKSYSFSLTVGKDKLTMGDVSVADWTEGTVIADTDTEEVKVTVTTSGTTATLTIPELATDAMVQKAMQEFDADGITTITANGNLSDAMHAAIISAISKKNTQGAVTNGKLSESSVTYTVHSAFTDALTTWIGTDGATLTLLANTPEYTDNIEIVGKTLTLDLNGHALNGSSSKYIQVGESDQVEGNNTEGGLTICDSGTGGAVNMNRLDIRAGSVNLHGCTLNHWVENLGTFNMTGGKVVFPSSMAIRTFGTLNISGGELSGRYGILATQGSVNISGSPVITGTDLNANNGGASLDEEAQEDLRVNKNWGTYKGAIYENIVGDMLVKQGYNLYYYSSDRPSLEMDFFVRDADSLIPVEVKANDNATASLNNLLKDGKYPDVKYGIKLGYKNICFNGKFYTFPYFLTFLLKRFVAERNK